MAENKSEVARLREEIAAAYAAADLALHASAWGTARHQIITARMERMGRCVEELATLVGIEEASRILVDTMENGV
jgi:hypothetical protein